jgi:CBS domain containing-hemolysin-like protein
MPWTSLAMVPLLIALNAFFVSAEYAVVAIRPAQIEAMRAGRWRRAAAAIERLKANPASAIGAIQVCITMTNLLLGWIGEPAMSALLMWAMGPLAQVVPEAVFRTGAFVLSFVIVTLLTVVFSELLPKALTLRYVTVAAALTAVPVLIVGQATRPLVWLMNAMANAVTRPLGLGSVDEIEKENVTVGELRLLATQAGGLTERARSLVLNSLAIGERRARDIMVPRIKVAFLDLQRSMDENRRVMNDYLYTRMPLCDGGMDRVIGVVPTKEFLAAYHAEGDVKVLSLIAHPPVYVPETVRIDRLLGAMHENRTQIVFLVDEFGGVEGIVTLQDVVDELVGQIGEAVEAGAVVHQTHAEDGAEGEMLVVSGDTAIHDLARELGLAGWAADAQVASVGGLVVARLSRVPRAGEAVEVEGVRLRVLESDERMVKRVEVTVVRRAETVGVND